MLFLYRKINFIKILQSYYWIMIVERRAVWLNRIRRKKKGEKEMLELRNIQKKYDGITVLKNINLTIADGEIVSILGPSG